jgi:hypothetical protein
MFDTLNHFVVNHSVSSSDPIKVLNQAQEYWAGLLRSDYCDRESLWEAFEILKQCESEAQLPYNEEF